MLAVRLFGPFEAQIDGRPMPRLRSRKGQVLLAHLLLRHDAEVQRDWLCEALWPESYLDQARLSLRQSLVDLRKALGPESDRLESPSNQTLRFRCEGAEIDVVRFEQLVALEEATDEAVAELVRLYRGPLMQGLRDESLLSPHDTRHEAMLQALECHAARSSEADAVRWLRAAAALDPLRESTHRSLMTALARSGSTGEALEVFRHLQGRLREQVGIEPDPKTIEISHELKQSLQDSHQQQARTGTGPSVGSFKSNVPKPLTSIIGREEEMKDLRDLIQEHRLVTITGLGGLGKTRLALEMAQEAGDLFPDGVLYVPLGEVSDPDLIGDKVARTAGFKSEGGASGAQVLKANFQASRTLLVLDNCEHLVSACAAFLSDLFEACSGLHVLATSRERIALVGESEYRLLPLRILAEEDTCAPAYRLFTERARLAAPALVFSHGQATMAAQICITLDGIPLAIELAAARLRALSLDQILARLENRFGLLKSVDRNRPERHRTLEATLEDSYRVLGTDEQKTFRELSVFEGGFTLEAAENVCTSPDALGALTHLIDSSLVFVPSADAQPLRYAMLDTVRVFGLMRLREAGEEVATRQRHYDEFVRLLAASTDRLLGADQVPWLLRLDAEQSNIRSAMASRSSNQEFAKIVGQQLFYWHLTSSVNECRSWIDQALTRLDGVDDECQARVYLVAAGMAWHRMDLERALGWARRSSEIARAIEDEVCLVSSLNMLGIILRASGDAEGAYEVGLEAANLARKRGEPARLARNLANLARAATASGRIAEGADVYRESLGLFKQVGDTRDYAHTMQSLAWNMSGQGYEDEARQMHREAIEILHGMKDEYRLAWSFNGLSSLCYRSSDFETSARLLGVVRGLEKRHNFEVTIPGSKRQESEDEGLRETLGPERFDALLHEGREMKIDEAVDLALNACR